MERIANYQWPSTRHAAPRGAAGVHNVDALTTVSAQVISLTNVVKAMTTASATINQVAEVFVFIVERGIYMIIVLKIQLQSIIWATSIDKIKTIHIQTFITLNGDNTQTFHGIIRTRLL